MKPCLSKLASLVAAIGLAGLAPPPAAAENLLGFTQIGSYTVLVGIDSDNPLIPNYVQCVSGLQPNQQLLDLDYRVSEDTVYALASTPGTTDSRSSLYSVNLETGELTPVVDPLDPDLPKDADNTIRFSFEFSPPSELIRIVSTGEANIVLNPDTGFQAPGVALTYEPGDPNENTAPDITAIAYDNTVLGSNPKLYGIDQHLGILTRVHGNPGYVNTIGSLGHGDWQTGGFDISTTGTAFALLSRENFIPIQRLYTLNLETGHAKNAGIAAFGILCLNGLTALTPPPPPPPNPLPETSAPAETPALAPDAPSSRRRR